MAIDTITEIVEADRADAAKWPVAHAGSFPLERGAKDGALSPKTVSR